MNKTANWIIQTISFLVYADCHIDIQFGSINIRIQLQMEENHTERVTIVSWSNALKYLQFCCCYVFSSLSDWVYTLCIMQNALRNMRNNNNKKVIFGYGENYESELVANDKTNVNGILVSFFFNFLPFKVIAALLIFLKHFKKYTINYIVRQCERFNGTAPSADFFSLSKRCDAAILLFVINCFVLLKCSLSKYLPYFFWYNLWKLEKVKKLVIHQS